MDDELDEDFDDVEEDKEGESYVDEELTIEQMLKVLANEIKKSQDILRMLKNMIKSLESKVESKTKPIKIDDMKVDEDEVIPIINYKKSCFRWEGPQVEAKTQHCNREFKCDICDYILESQGLLEAHRKGVHQPSSVWLKIRHERSTRNSHEEWTCNRNGVQLWWLQFSRRWGIRTEEAYKCSP